VAQDSPHLWVQLGAALRAQQAGRAIRVSAMPAVVPHREQAVIMAPIFLPGDPDRIWAVALGRPEDAAPTVYATASPVRWASQRDLWRRWVLGDPPNEGSSLERLVDQAREGGCTPQLVVASDRVVYQLALAAQRMLPLPRQHDERQFWVSWWARWLLLQAAETERPGSHHLVPMERVLDAHWAWPYHCINLRQRLAALQAATDNPCDNPWEGLPEHEDQDLEPWSAWEDFSPPEHSKAGAELNRWVRQQHKAFVAQKRSEGRPGGALQGTLQDQQIVQEKIQRIVSDKAAQVWKRVRDAYVLYCEQPWEGTLPMRPWWCEQQRLALDWVWQRRERGQLLPPEPGHTQQVVQMQVREALLQTWTSCLRLGDPWHLQLALAQGEAVQGQLVQDSEIPEVGWVLQTPQVNCCLRVGERVQVLEHLQQLWHKKEARSGGALGEGLRNLLREAKSLEIQSQQVLQGGQLLQLHLRGHPGLQPRPEQVVTLVPQFPIWPGRWAVDKRLVGDNRGVPGIADTERRRKPWDIEAVLERLAQAQVRAQEPRQ